MEPLIVDSGDKCLRDLPAVVMFGDALHRTAERRLPPHYNPGIEICLCRRGVYRWNVEGRIVEIKPGEVSITRPWEEHSGVNNVLGPGRLSWLVLTAKAEPPLDSRPLAELLAGDGEWALASIGDSRRHQLGELPEAVPAFDRISRELESNRPGGGAVVRAAVALLVVSIARRIDAEVAEAAEPVPDGVVLALREVAASPERDWTTTHMASRAGLGVTAFTDWCRRLTGRSPRWYLIEERLRWARVLLADRHRSITEVALQTGFSSSQHFSTSFKKLYGETPTTFRRAIAQAESDSGSGGTYR